MNRRVGITLTAALMALGLCSLAAYSADDDDKEGILKAQKDIKKLVADMKAGGDVKAQARAIHAKYKDDLKFVMWVYKPQKKNGIGMGKDGAGIENELGRLSSPKSRLTPAKVKEMKDDLIKAAEYSKAVAEVTDLYPQKKNGDKWKQYTREMKKGADELIKAADGGNPADVKKAITNLNSSCTNCHSDFRND